MTIQNVKIGEEPQPTPEEKEKQQLFIEYQWFYKTIEKVAKEEGIQISKGTPINKIVDALETYLEG